MVMITDECECFADEGCACEEMCECVCDCEDCGDAVEVIMCGCGGNCACGASES